MMNKNPNCNHNSSQFYNSCSVNLKFEKESTIVSEDKNTPSTDLLWKNGDQYSEREELNALAAVLYKLFSNPKLGENMSEKKRSKLKTIAGNKSISFNCII